MTTTEDSKPQSSAPQSLDAEQVGYKQSLNRRHVQMIAIGGAIGTGLFLGSASRLNSTGPALLFSYAFVGVIAYFLMRALGELVLHRPTSGAFVSYMREFFGEKAAFVTGWLYWLNWGLTGIAELSAVGLYVQFWIPTMPTWATVLIALAVVLTINLLSARAFGEFEFWASVLKVGAIVAFLTGSDWPFHGATRLSVTEAQAINISNDETRSFWIRDTGTVVGLVRLLDLDDVDEGSPRVLRKALLHLADELSRRLRAESLAGRTVTLKYRDETFRTTTHARSGKTATNVASELFDTAAALFDEVHGSLKVRLLGIGVSGFAEPVQKSLFEQQGPTRGARIDELRDSVRRKFGKEALVRASDLEDEKKQEP